MIIRTLLFALSLLLWSDLPAVSKGSNPYKDEPWNPHHIDNLPIEYDSTLREFVGGRPALSMTLQPISRAKGAGE